MQATGTWGALAAAACMALGLGAVAPAQAQGSVQLSGLIDLYAGSMRMAGESKHTNTMGYNGMSTSWWGISGTEDLGGGTQALFNFGAFFRPTNGASGRFDGDTFWSRDAKVGLRGDFGTLWLGRGEAPNFLPTILFNPFGDSFAFSPLVLHANVPPFTNGTLPSVNPSGWSFPSTTSAADTGWSNLVAYTTPDFHGLTATLHYQFAGAGDSNGRRNVGINALYFNGPIGLTAFYEDARSSNPVVASLGSTRKDWMVGGSYDFTAVKLYATYGQARDNGARERLKTASAGASVPVGPGKILAAYAHTRSKMLDSTRQTATVGYDYDLSKRTDVYGNVMYDKVSRFSGGTSFAVGIRHRF